MAARKKAARKRPRRKTPGKKAARKKKAARRDQSARPKRPGSTKAARVKTGGSGKPRVDFDLDDLEEMAREWLPHEFMATLLGVSRSTLQERIADTPAVALAIERGRARRAQSLMRRQWEGADAGNVTMQIWLGKNYLGQTDKIVHAGDPDAPVPGDLGDALTMKLIEFIQHRQRVAATAPAG